MYVMMINGRGMAVSKRPKGSIRCTLPPAHACVILCMSMRTCTYIHIQIPNTHVCMYTYTFNKMDGLLAHACVILFMYM